MTVFFSWILRTIGIGGCAFLCLWIYDWGIPGAARIPFLTSIPIIGDLTTGRAHTYAADQVKLATAQMVGKYELLSAQAQYLREKHLREQAEQAAEDARKRAAVTAAIAAQQQTQIEALAAEAKKAPGLSWPTKEDLEWQSKH